MADAQALRQLQAFVDEALHGRTRLRVLDAGCGSSSYVKAPESAHRVGIDISEEQLRKNTFVDEKILGDIQTYELPPASFDVIICWWVLEHLREPASDGAACPADARTAGRRHPDEPPEDQGCV